jgi:hypothetical protein
MPTDRPDAQELLTTVREHLQNNVAPLLDGQPAFHLRVATNALAIIERTLKDGPAMDETEQERLTEILDEDADLLGLNRSLVEKIRKDDLGDQRDATLTHLRETAVDKLKLSNPKYLTPRD